MVIMTEACFGVLSGSHSYVPRSYDPTVGTIIWSYKYARPRSWFKHRIVRLYSLQGELLQMAMGKGSSRKDPAQNRTAFPTLSPALEQAAGSKRKLKIDGYSA